MATTIVTADGKLQGGWEGKLSNLYAVITQEGSHTLIYDDGHVRVRFHESGNGFTGERKGDDALSLDEYVRHIADGLTKLGRPAQIHIAPFFASDDAARVWFETIGLRLTDAGAQKELRELGLTD